MRSVRRWLLCAGFVLARCTCESKPERDNTVAPQPVPTPVAATRDAGVHADVPDAEVRDVSKPDAGAARAIPPPVVTRRRCPAEMVDVAGAFCIDRHEVSLVDRRRGRALSPFYPPTQKGTLSLLERWQTQRSTLGPAWARALALPQPPAWQLEEDFAPRAVVKPNSIPSGYLDGPSAARACANAGKRLCSEREWLTACRGERNRDFPYGDRYVPGACNVMRRSHPAAILHDDASIGHLDPRLNLTRDSEGPLLRKTGASPRCASRWGNDAIYDMVGNLDEWIADPAGTFMGGFYARQTNKGCQSRIASHPYGYYDYSLGTRCCR
jgi:formylglycine-generating enzyme required for sulfatase activity